MGWLILCRSSKLPNQSSELLGKQRRKRKPWVTPEILDLCDQRRDLKKKRGEPEGAEDYREIKRKIRTEMKMAKETWIQGQCQEVEACLRKNNSKKAYQLVKDLTTEKHGKSTTIQDKSGKCLTEENEILNRWTEYCSDISLMKHYFLSASLSFVTEGKSKDFERTAPKLLGGSNILKNSERIT